jgi:hypothetical protein
MSTPTPPSAPIQPTPAPTVPKPVTPLQWAFRFIRWSTYLAAFITLILIFRKSPPPPVQTDPQAAARAEQKVYEAEKTASTGQGATLKLDETELNSMLATRLAQAMQSSAPVAMPNGLPNAAPASSTPLGSVSGSSEAPSAGDIEQMKSNVKDVKVQMEGDIVKAYVVFDVHGKDMTLELQGHLGASDGFLKFEPVAGQIGSLPIPQSALQSAVQKMMDSPENREKLRLPPDISDLKIVNGELVTTYKDKEN